MIGTSRARQAPAGPELWKLDPEHDRYAVAVDGRITYAGSLEECRRRLDLLKRDPDGRIRQNRALKRICA